MTDDTEDFDWLRDDSVVIREQPALAIFRNRFGDIVIAQQGHYGPDEDKHVYVRPENVLVLIKGLAREVGWGEVDIVPRESPVQVEPEDTTEEPPLLRVINSREALIAAE